MEDNRLTYIFKENKTELLKRIEESTRLLEDKIVEIQKKLLA